MYSADPFQHLSITTQSTKGGGVWEGVDYVVYMYPLSPHAIHPPHIVSAILGESVIVLRRFQIHSYNIVSLLHGIV